MMPCSELLPGAGHGCYIRFRGAKHPGLSSSTFGEITAGKDPSGAQHHPAASPALGEGSANSDHFAECRERAGAGLQTTCLPNACFRNLHGYFQKESNDNTRSCPSLTESSRLS